MRKTTIEEVAALARVSIKTVSRVINDEPNVRESTRLKVVDAIERLGYRPDQSARRLAGARSYLVGLLYDNPSASYVIDIQTGALDRCRAESYELLINPCNYKNPDLCAEIENLVGHARLDGLILTPPLSDHQNLIAMLREQEIPFVMVAPPDDSDAVRSVFTNDREASCEMTRYLLSLGHERIGYILGHPDHGAVGTRYLGYRDALAHAGIRFQKGLMDQGYNSFRSGEDAARRLLGKKNRPTAILCGNDEMAAGAMKVAHEMGLSIPEDLSVAGFDDVPLAGQIWPSLTTIRQPIREMAEKAADLLLKQIRGEAVSGLQSIRSTLVIRDSTGPAYGGLSVEHKRAGGQKEVTDAG
jgi:LacI family transcriptional regulator